MNIFRMPGLGWLRKILEERQARPFSIALDYPVHPRPRYGYGQPLHAELAGILGSRRACYRELLESFLPYYEDLWRIQPAPVWINGFLPGLDAASLYCLIRIHQPRVYLEIGSGHSTRFARRAIQDGQLATRIISVDPHPRVDIRTVADQVI